MCIFWYSGSIQLQQTKYIFFDTAVRVFVPWITHHHTSSMKRNRTNYREKRETRSIIERISNNSLHSRATGHGASSLCLETWNSCLRFSASTLREISPDKEERSICILLQLVRALQVDRKWMKSRIASFYVELCNTSLLVSLEFSVKQRDT